MLAASFDNLAERNHGPTEPVEQPELPIERSDRDDPSATRLAPSPEGVIHQHRRRIREAPPGLVVPGFRSRDLDAPPVGHRQGEGPPPIVDGPRETEPADQIDRRPPQTRPKQDPSRDGHPPPDLAEAGQLEARQHRRVTPPEFECGRAGSFGVVEEVGLALRDRLPTDCPFEVDELVAGLAQAIPQLDILGAPKVHREPTDGYEGRSLD